MTFINYKTGFIMLLLLFMLSGGSSNDNHYEDNSQSFVTEQPDIEDEKPVISRKRSISENMDDYFEEVNTESKSEITDILDNENEFLVSDEWDMRIIYIYLLSDKGYEKYIFSVNYAEQESVNIQLQDNTTEMYVLCPEYTNVEALTKSYSAAAEEHSLYVVDEDGNMGKVGGNLRYRVFAIDVSAREKIEFELCDALESDDYMTYGGFIIQF